MSTVHDGMFLRVAPCVLDSGNAHGGSVVTASLFDEPPVPGLRYRPDLLAPAEEAELLARCLALELRPFQFQQWEGKRRTASFGWSYDFTDARLEPAPPLPAFLAPLRERAAHLADLPAASFEHALVIEYPAGAGIGWHRDRPAFGVVVGVSLLAPCTLRLRRRRAGKFERAALELAPRSAYVLDGVVRRDWEHSIAPLPVPRWSVTFRTLVQRPVTARAAAPPSRTAAE